MVETGSLDFFFFIYILGSFVALISYRDASSSASPFTTKVHIVLV